MERQDASTSRIEDRFDRLLDLHRAVLINQKVHRSRLIVTAITPQLDCQGPHLFESTPLKMLPRTPSLSDIRRV